MRQENMRVGMRVRVSVEIDLFPRGVFGVGLTGTVTAVYPIRSPDIYSRVAIVRLDRPVATLAGDELDVWDQDDYDFGGCSADRFEPIGEPPGIGS